MTQEELKKAIKELDYNPLEWDSLILARRVKAVLEAINPTPGEGVSTEELFDFEEFDESTGYSKTDIIKKEGKLYEFTANKTAGAWDPSKVEQTNLFTILNNPIVKLEDKVDELEDKVDEYHFIPTVTISALTTSDMTAEQAAAAGFTPAVIAALQAAHNPTIEFSDMCVTFNSVEVVSGDLVNQSAVIVHPEETVLELYKVLLSLNTNGAVTYTVTKLS